MSQLTRGKGKVIETGFGVSSGNMNNGMKNNKYYYFILSDGKCFHIQVIEYYRGVSHDGIYTGIAGSISKMIDKAMRKKDYVFVTYPKLSKHMPSILTGTGYKKSNTFLNVCVRKDGK